MKATIPNQHLLGDIGVRLLLIEGDRSNRFAERERANIADQLGKAVAFLREAEPRAMLEFHLDEARCRLDEGRSQLDSQEGAGEQEWWCAQALQMLGYASHEDYLKQWLTEVGCAQGFVVVVSKLPMVHFAYATGAKVVLSYYAGGFGIKNLHALAVHEICHLFGAVDEEGEHVRCIMAGNDLALCDATRRQIGWHPSFLVRAQ